MNPGPTAGEVSRVLSRIRSNLPRFAPARLITLCGERENRPVVAVLAACAAFLLWKARFLLYPDLAFAYPFVQFDSFQWMLDSLLYRGRDVSAVYRNPGLPLVLALLGALGRMAWLPLVTVALSAMFAMYLVLLLRRHFAPVPTALALLLVFFTFSLQTAFDFVLADQWAVTFQLAAVYHLIEAEDDPRHLRSCAAWSATSFLFQYAIAALAPACLLYAVLVLRPRSRDVRAFDRNLVTGAVLAFALVAPLLVYKAVKFGNPMYSGVIQAQLVKPHFFGVVFYAINALAFYGAPVALLSAYGFIRAVRERGAESLIAVCILSYFVFWVLLYVWLDPRFLLYFAPFVAFCLAKALTEMRVEPWFGGRGGTLPQALTGWGALGFALLCGLYERSDPYSRNEVPLTPQTELVLGMGRITQWEGNVTISLEGLRLVDTTGNVPAIHFLKSYYREHRASIDRNLEREAAELVRARDALPRGARLAGCGQLSTDYRSTMRRELALERRLAPCERDVPFRLVPARDGPGPSEQVVFSGEMYRVIGSVASQRRDGPDIPDAQKR